MRRATITEAKNSLSALLDQVRGGQSVLILDRGVPVARIEPVAQSGDQAGVLARLERAGLVRRPARALAPSVLDGPRPTVGGGASALAILLEERRQDR